MSLIPFSVAFDDPKLLGAYEPFRNRDSWARWRVFAKAFDGLPLSPDEEAIFTEHTGLSAYDPPQPGGWREFVFVVGRQSGKTTIAAALTVHTALLGTGPGDVALLIGQDARASQRVALGTIASIIRASPMFEKEVDGEIGQERIRLKNGVDLLALPCRPASVRGLRAKLVLLDEIAHFRSTSMAPVDAEMLRAVRPTTANTGAKIVILSSPAGKQGALFDLVKRHHGRPSQTLIWRGGSQTMNPSIDVSVLTRIREEDSVGAKAELDGEFLDNLVSLFDPAVIDRAVETDRPLERPPEPEVRYQAFADLSGGRSDASVVAIGHKQDDRAIVDCVRIWPAPQFGPGQVVPEAAELLSRYRLSKLVGDRYAAGWPEQKFREHGVRYAAARAPKSELYLASLASFNSHAVEIPAIAVLIGELKALERRRSPSGKDRVDHPSGAGSHDDAGNAVCGLVDLLLHQRRRCNWEDLYPANPDDGWRDVC